MISKQIPELYKKVRSNNGKLEYYESITLLKNKNSMVKNGFDPFYKHNYESIFNDLIKSFNIDSKVIRQKNNSDEIPYEMRFLYDPPVISNFDEVD